MVILLGHCRFWSVRVDESVPHVLQQWYLSNLDTLWIISAGIRLYGVPVHKSAGEKRLAFILRTNFSDARTYRAG
jgi:hypothetical protein